MKDIISNIICCERGDIIFYNNSVLRTLALVSQLGISILTPIFLCTYIGYKIDGHFGTHWTIPLLLLGILAGVNMAYRLVKNILKKQKEEETAQNAKQNKNKREVVKPKLKSRIFKENGDE